MPAPRSSEPRSSEPRSSEPRSSEPRSSEPRSSEPDSTPTHTYEYAIVRVVPRVERGEFLNVGAILYCKALSFLGAQFALDRARLAALFPFCEAELIPPHLEAIARVCRGGAEAGALGALSQVERFHWLVAPRSTIIQPSPVHTGYCADPAATLDELIARMVCLPADEREPLP